MDRKRRISIAALAFIVTGTLCYEIAAQIAGQGNLPPSIQYRNGYPNEYLVYTFVIVAILSFSIGVFTLAKSKLIALVITVVGLLLLSLLTFIAGVSQANIGY